MDKAELRKIICKTTKEFIETVQGLSEFSPILAKTPIAESIKTCDDFEHATAKIVTLFITILIRQLSDHPDHY